MRNIGLQFFFPVMYLSSFGIRLMQDAQSKDVFSPPLVSGRDSWEMVIFLPWMFSSIHQRCHLGWCFLFWKFNYWFNFKNRPIPVHILYFSLCVFWQFVDFKELLHFFCTIQAARKGCAWSRLTLFSPMEWSPPPCSAVCGISQARILEWVILSFSRDLPGIEPMSPVSPALAEKVSIPSVSFQCPWNQ